MNTISAHPSRPIDPNKASVLAKVSSLARSVSTAPMLVGAFARDVWFWHLHGIETQRATEDLDISVELPDWHAFNELAAVLLGNGFSQNEPGHPEKLQDRDTGIFIDLLPFGGLSTDGHSIIWPSDNSRWGILGFEESHRASQTLILSREAATGIRIVPMCSLVILKTIAMHERLHARRKKDGSDIGFIIENYLKAGHRERLLVGREATVMNEVNGDLLRASAWLSPRESGNQGTGFGTPASRRSQPF